MRATSVSNALTIDTEMDDDDMPTLALESPSPIMPADNQSVALASPLASTSTAITPVPVRTSSPTRKKSVKQVRKHATPPVASPAAPASPIDVDIKPAVNGGVVVLKARMTKDPNAPKYPSTCYTLFLAERRAEHVAANPTLKAAEMGRVMGEMWRAISDDDRAVYVAKAAVLKEAYDAAVDAYNDSDECKMWNEFQRDKTVVGDKKKGAPTENTPHIDDIPIFSEAFLAYNKEQDRQLRVTRKRTGEVSDEQNGLRKRLALLEKHAARRAQDGAPPDARRLDELHVKAVAHLASIGGAIKTTVKWMPKNQQTLSTPELVDVALKSPVRRKFMLDLAVPQ